MKTHSLRFPASVSVFVFCVFMTLTFHTHSRNLLSAFSCWILNSGFKKIKIRESLQDCGPLQHMWTFLCDRIQKEAPLVGTVQHLFWLVWGGSFQFVTKPPDWWASCCSEKWLMETWFMEEQHNRLYFWKVLSCFIFNGLIFFDKNPHLYKLCFLRRPTELLDRSILDFCQQPSFCLLTICWLGSHRMFALSPLVHTPPLYNLCKAGISRTLRNAVCFFYSSHKQKLRRARTPAHGWQPRVVSFV